MSTTFIPFWIFVMRLVPGSRSMRVPWAAARNLFIPSLLNRSLHAPEKRLNQEVNATTTPVDAGEVHYFSRMLSAPTNFAQLEMGQLSSSRVEISAQSVLLVLVGIILICMFCFATVMTTRAPNTKEEVDDDEEQDQQDDIHHAEQLAAALRRTIRKLPVTRKSKSGHTKERFIAVLRCSDSASPKLTSPTAKVRHSRKGLPTVKDIWENGKVAWWHDRAWFERGDAQKGELALKAIVDAKGGLQEKYEKCEVEIVFTDGSETKRLLLFTPTSQEASEWAASFNKFLRLVRGRPDPSRRTRLRLPTSFEASSTFENLRTRFLSGASSLSAEAPTEDTDEETDDNDRGN